MSKVHYIILRDAVEYKFDADKFTPEQAREMACELWEERCPQIAVCANEEEDDPENPTVS